MNEKTRLENVQMRLAEKQMQYIIDCKRLEELAKPRSTCVYAELIEAIDLAKNIATHIAVKTTMEEIAVEMFQELTKRLTTEGFVAVFGDSIEPLILKEAQLISQRQLEKNLSIDIPPTKQ